MDGWKAYSYWTYVGLLFKTGRLATIEPESHTKCCRLAAAFTCQTLLLQIGYMGPSPTCTERMVFDSACTSYIPDLNVDGITSFIPE